MVLSFSKKFPWGEPTNFVDKIKNKVKIHTVREDKHRRWNPGRDIHFATGVRTKNYNNFLMDKCQAVERVYIQPAFNIVSVHDGKNWIDVHVEEFAKNDGFDCEADFWRWFDEDFYGVIIHWTDKRYAE